MLEHPPNRFPVNANVPFPRQRVVHSEMPTQRGHVTLYHTRHHAEETSVDTQHVLKVCALQHAQLAHGLGLGRARTLPILGQPQQRQLSKQTPRLRLIHLPPSDR